MATLLNAIASAAHYPSAGPLIPPTTTEPNDRVSVIDSSSEQTTSGQTPPRLKAHEHLQSVAMAEVDDGLQEDEGGVISPSLRRCHSLIICSQLLVRRWNPNRR
jgi:hypothetical protein